MTQSRILIVEDEPLVALDLQAQLTQLGYEVLGITGQGEEAVTLAGELRPNVVLMDIRLQGAMDGISAAQKIRDCFGSAIVFLTAHAEDEKQVLSRDLLRQRPAFEVIAVRDVVCPCPRELPLLLGDGPTRRRVDAVKAKMSTDFSNQLLRRPARKVPCCCQDVLLSCLEREIDCRGQFGCRVRQTKRNEGRIGALDGEMVPFTEYDVRDPDI